MHMISHVPNPIREVRVYEFYGSDEFVFDNLTSFDNLHVYRNSDGMYSYVFERIHEKYKQTHTFAYKNSDLDLEKMLLSCFKYSSEEDAKQDTEKSTNSTCEKIRI